MSAAMMLSTWLTTLVAGIYQSSDAKTMISGISDSRK